MHTLPAEQGLLIIMTLNKPLMTSLTGGLVEKILILLKKLLYYQSIQFFANSHLLKMCQYEAIAVRIKSALCLSDSISIPELTV